MIFEQIPVGHMQNFSYIIADEKTKEAEQITRSSKVLHSREEFVRFMETIKS